MIEQKGLGPNSSEKKKVHVLDFINSISAGTNGIINLIT